MVHFIGIKGSGMASLACILNDLGETVTGSDIEKYIFTQQPLEARKIKITPFDADNIQPGMNVIIGNAFDESIVKLLRHCIPRVSKAIIIMNIWVSWLNVIRPSA